jgi:Na+/H+-dicarboxylate symporter
MCRTTLNVVGDLTAATYVARAEGYPLLQTAHRGGAEIAEDAEDKRQTASG